jgi:hypothetical protein
MGGLKRLNDMRFVRNLRGKPWDGYEASLQVMRNAARWNSREKGGVQGAARRALQDQSLSHRRGSGTCSGDRREPGGTKEGV